jgi:murein DD-endopeptidase MepM/ murein hydrolase activator NlpD
VKKKKLRERLFAGPRQWTFLVWSDQGGHTRQYSLTASLLKKGVFGILLTVAGLSMALAGFFSNAGERVRHARLERENRLLAQQLTAQRKALDQLEGTLDDLQKRDEEFRVLAGLEPLSPAVYRAGIGGPGGSGEESRHPVLGKAFSSGSFDLDAITQRVRVLRSSLDQAMGTLQTKRDRLAATPSILPATGFLSSEFTNARWHPILDDNRPHAGIDIAAPTGTPIYAAARARVAFVGYRGQYGLMVELDHGHGYMTRYAHLSRALVRPGQTVIRRAQIGEVGETGLAIGPHLHYEVLVNGVARNPVGFIFDQGALPD